MADPSSDVHSGPIGGLTFDEVMHRLRRRHFAVLATADDQARPQAAGVVYGVSEERAAFYVMTRRHLQKARNIAVNPRVSLVVPLPRRLMPLLPPPCIQFQGTAELLDRKDPNGTKALGSFLLGRTITRIYERMERRGERRICFVCVKPGPVIFTYAVGTSMWRLGSRMEGGLARVEVPADERA